MSNRPENDAFQRFKEAQLARNEEWPEPETSALYQSLVGGARAIVFGVLGHNEPELSREIATRTLLRLRNFKGRSQFSTWFYRLARNEAIRFVTDNAPREEQFDEAFEPEAPPAVPLSLPRSLRNTEVKLLKLVLRGESFERIGKILGCSKMAVSRRWAKLRKKLGELYGC